MTDLSATIKAHFIHETLGLICKRTINFAPSVGDELRFEGEKYFRVTLLVWVFDEPETPFTRLNVGVVEATK